MKSETIEKRNNRLFARQVVQVPIATAQEFSAMYERNHIAVYRYIYGLTGGPPSEVEDLTSETFMRAWKNRQAYRGEPADAVGWVLRIARNLVIDHYRAQQRNFLLETDLLDEAMPSPVTEEQQPEHHSNKTKNFEHIIFIVSKIVEEMFRFHIQVFPYKISCAFFKIFERLI